MFNYIAFLPMPFFYMDFGSVFETLLHRFGTVELTRRLAYCLHRQDAQTSIGTSRVSDRSITMSTQNPDPHCQEAEAKRGNKPASGARGTHGAGNAGAHGDPNADQSQHNYQASRASDMNQHADDAAKRAEEIDTARKNKTHDV